MAPTITAEDLRPPEGFSFEEEGHVYRLSDSGPRLSSVTEVLGHHGLGGDFSGVHPSVLARAARRGTEFHRAMEFAVDDDLDWTSLDSAMAENVSAALAELETARVRPILTEVRLVSETLSVAGTTDLLGTIYEVEDLAIVDYKTGSDEGADIQLTLYGQLARETYAIRTGEDLGTLRLFVMNVSAGRASLREVEPIPIGAAKALVRSYNFIRSRRLDV